MTPSFAGRPVIFLDVDGPLIPFKTRPAGQRRPSGVTGLTEADFVAVHRWLQEGHGTV
ncbi:hypothetical protein ACIA47_03910 [Micromonospora sp. NPDC051227]|uniref:hypothetical protein n=1 Tax=Micromonospora sp. NPDC051227 TaxID=3364285 RepID=UPI0037B641C1